MYYKNYTSVKIVCGCARYLPFPNNYFDRIIAFHVFPHIQGKQLALHECWRVLKQFSELAIIHLNGSDEINAIHREIGGAVKNHRLPDANQMCRMLEQTNFHIKEAIDRTGEYFLRGIKLFYASKN